MGELCADRQTDRPGAYVGDCGDKARLYTELLYVTMVWQSMAGGTLPTLVGYTAQGPNVDLGNMDLSAAIPAMIQTIRKPITPT